jgi:hypothetical protein
MKGITLFGMWTTVRPIQVIYFVLFLTKEIKDLIDAMVVLIVQIV